MLSQNQHRKSRSNQVTTLGLLTALALIFSYVEAVFPVSAGAPGVKLGIANLVIIIALYKMGFGDALTINVVRILVSGLLFTGLFGSLYSLSGGLTSLVVMYLLKKTGKFSIVGVSMAGGVFHNFGQLFIAGIIVENYGVYTYLPILTASGIVMGIAIGIIAYYLDLKLPNKMFRR